MNRIPRTKATYLKELIRRAKVGLFPSAGHGICFYRKNRRRNCEIACAVGVLIPNDKYSSRLERQGFFVRPDKGDAHQMALHAAVQIPKGVTKNQLQRIQRTHDELPRHNGKWTEETRNTFIAEVTRILS